MTLSSNTLGEHKKPVFAVNQLSNNLIASGSLDGVVKLWNLKKNKCVNTLREEGPVFSLLSGTGDTLYTGLGNGVVNRWQFEQDKVSVHSVSAHRGAVTAFARISEKQFVTASKDGLLRIWDEESLKPIGVLSEPRRAHAGEVWSVIPLPYERLASAGRDGRICIWSLRSYRCVDVNRMSRGWVRSLAVLPDGCLVSSSSSEIDLWDPCSVGVLGKLKGHRRDVVALTVSACGDLVSGSDDETIKVWNVREGRLLHTSKGNSLGVKVLCKASDGRIVSGGWDGSVSLTTLPQEDFSKTNAWKALVTIDLQEPIQSIEGLPSSLCVSTKSFWSVWGMIVGYYVRHGYDPRSSNRPHNPLSSSWRRQAIALFVKKGLDPKENAVPLWNGELAEPQLDGTIKILDAANGKITQILKGHKATVKQLVQYPGGLLISGSEDGHLIMWGAPSRIPLKKIDSRKWFSFNDVEVWARKGNPLPSWGKFKKLFDRSLSCTAEWQSGVEYVHSGVYYGSGANAKQAVYEYTTYRINPRSLVPLPDGRIATLDQEGTINFFAPDRSKERMSCRVIKSGGHLLYPLSMNELLVAQKNQIAIYDIWPGAGRGAPKLGPRQYGEKPEKQFVFNRCRLKRLLSGHKHPISCLIQSSNGLLITAGRSVRVWNLQTWQSVEKRRFQAPVRAIVIHPSGKIWYVLEKNKELPAFIVDQVVRISPTKVALSGRTSNGTSEVKIFDLVSKKTLASYPWKATRLLALSEDYLAVANKWIEIRNISSGKLVGRLDSTAEGGLAIDSNKRLISGEPGILKRWEYSILKRMCYPIYLWNERGKCLKTLQGHTEPVTSLTSLGEKILVSGSSDGTIRIWGPLGKCLQVLSLHSGRITSLISLDTKRFVSGSFDRTIRIWNKSGKCLSVFQSSEYVIALARLSGEMFVSASQEDPFNPKATIQIWHTGRKCLRTVQVPISNVLGWGRGVLAAFEEGSFVSSICLKKYGIRIWNSQGEALKTLQFVREFVALAYRSGKFFVSDAEDNAIKVYDRSGKALSVHKGHRKTVRALVVLAGGLCVSGSDDKTIRIWNNKEKSAHILYRDNKVTTLALFGKGLFASN